MCWSGQASATLAALGYTGAYFEFRKMKKNNQSMTDTYGLRGMGIFYLSLMETLQAGNYTVLHTPGFLNSLFSLLGYLHICFQSYFINFINLSLLPERRRKYWMKYAILFSTITAIAMLSRLLVSPTLPGCFANYCSPLKDINNLFYIKVLASQTIGCTSQSFLSYPGDWHIAWQWVLNSCNLMVFTYFFSVFILPCLYGVILSVISSTFFGPVMAIFSTNNPDEFGAIWCLIAIALASSIKIPVWERLISVRHQSWRETYLAYFNWLNKSHVNFHQSQNLNIDR